MKNGYLAQAVTLIRPSMMARIPQASDDAERLALIVEAHEDLRAALAARELARRLSDDITFVETEDAVARRQDALYAVIALLTTDEPGVDNEPME